METKTTQQLISLMLLDGDLRNRFVANPMDTVADLPVSVSEEDLVTILVIDEVDCENPIEYDVLPVLVSACEVHTVCTCGKGYWAER